MRGSHLSLFGQSYPLATSPSPGSPYSLKVPSLCPSESSLISTPVAKNLPSPPRPSETFSLWEKCVGFSAPPPHPLRWQRLAKPCSCQLVTSLCRGNSANRLSCVLVTSSRLASPQPSLHHASLVSTETARAPVCVTQGLGMLFLPPPPTPER